MGIAMYDYIGYYDICYIGDEVRDPARVIPRSILYCILATAVAYLAVEIIVIGVVPWREAANSSYIVSDFMQRLYGHKVALLFTVLILWTAFASVFALLLGYSRIPYAAAVDGYFFKPFARLHPTKDFPYISLLTLGAVAIISAFFRLDQVISALLTTRILVQFIRTGPRWTSARVCSRESRCSMGCGTQSTELLTSELQLFLAEPLAFRPHSSPPPSPQEPRRGDRVRERCRSV